METRGTRSFVGLLAAIGVVFLLAVSISCSGGRHSRRILFAAALLPSEQAEYTAVLHSFTQKTGIPVTVVAQQYDQIRMSLQAESRGGHGQSFVVELDVYMLPLLQSLMLPIGSLFTLPDSLKNDVPPDAWRAGLLGTPPELFFVPHRLNWQALIYNARVLSKPPKTWEDLLRVARKHPGAIGLKAARYEGLVCDLFPFVWQTGGDVLHPDAPPVYEAMRFLQKLSPYFNPFVRSYKENSILQAQEQDEILLHPNWPFVVPLLREKGLLPGTLRTAPLPAGPAGVATVLGGGYLGIPKTAPHPELAGKLIRYLTTAGVQRSLVSKLGWFPIRRDAWSAMTKRERRDFSGFLAMRNAVRARPPLLAYPKISQIWQDGFYRMIFGKENPEKILPEMQRKINALLQKGAL